MSMTDLINGMELNLCWDLISIDLLSSQNKVHERLCEVVLGFELDRETYPVGCDMHNGIEVNDSGELIEISEDNSIVIGHYCVYSDVPYEIVKDFDHINRRKFLDWDVYENEDEDYDNLLVAEGLIGPAIAEQTFALIKKGDACVVIREDLSYGMLDGSSAPDGLEQDLDEETKSELMQLSERIWSHISN